MNYRNVLIYLMLTGLALAQHGREKQEFPWENGGRQTDVIKVSTPYNFTINARPPINFNIFVDIDPATHRRLIRLGTSVLYDLLQFEKAEEGYEARYQLSLAIREQHDTRLKKTWSNEITVDHFETTNAKDIYDVHGFELFPEEPLSPGTYDGWLEIHDQISRQTYRSRRIVNIPAEPDGDGAGLLSTEAVFAFPEDSFSTEIRITPALRTLEFGKPVNMIMRYLSKTGGYEEVNMRLYKNENGVDKLYRQEYLHARVENGLATLIYPIPSDSLPEGMYKIRLRSQNPVLEIERTFSVVWFEKPIYLYSSDLALQPMRYILSEEEFDRANSLDKDELDRWIHNFWKAKDPTPQSDYNEISAEFYERVHLANQRYTTKYRRGWQTDRGRILILYGEPDKILNRRYSTDQLPHIIWRYNNGQEFVFVDDNNDQDFTLIEPE